MEASFWIILPPRFASSGMPGWKQRVPEYFGGISGCLDGFCFLLDYCLYPLCTWRIHILRLTIVCFINCLNINCISLNLASIIASAVRLVCEDGDTVRPLFREFRMSFYILRVLEYHPLVCLESSLVAVCLQCFHLFPCVDYKCLHYFLFIWIGEWLVVSLFFLAGLLEIVSDSLARRFK